MVFAANTDPANMYRLEIEKVYLHKDGQLLSDIHPGDFLIPVHADYVMMNSNSRGVFLDSGTPFTQLDKTLSAPFMEAWKSITNKDYSNDVLVDESDVSSLPTVVFQFKGTDNNHDIDPETIPGLAGSIDSENKYSVLVAMPSKHYMEKDSKTGKFKSRLFIDHPSRTILAANFMRGHDIYFQVDEGRIGFAEADICERDPLGSGEPAQTGFYGERDYDAINPASYPEAAHPRGADARGANGIGPAEVECDSFYSCCVTATCRSFVAVGYALIVIVGIASFAAMKGGK